MSTIEDIDTTEQWLEGTDFSIPSDNNQFADLLCLHDPLYQLLTTFWNLNEYAVAGVALFVSTFVLLGLGTLFQMTNDMNYLIRSIVQAWLVFPVLALLCIRIPREIAILFNTLRPKVLAPLTDIPEDEQMGLRSYEQLVSLLITQTNRIWWSLGAGAILVLYWLYELFIIGFSQSGEGPMTFRLAQLCVYSILIYSALLAVQRFFVAIYYINILFRTFQLKISPLDPDGSAGLGMMERMLGVSAAFITVMGIAALVLNSWFLSLSLPHSTIPVNQIWEAVLFSIIYLIMAPILLSGWLLSPHTAMQEALNDTLRPLSEQIENTIISTMPSANSTSSEIKEGTDRLVELKRRYDLLANTYPLWPAQIRQIRRLAATVSLPALITFLASLPSTYNTIVPFIVHLFQR